MITFTIIFLTLSISQNPFDRKNIIRSINDERSNMGLGQIVYNSDLQNDLELYRDVYGAEWFFQNSSIFNNTVPIIWKNSTLETRIQKLNGQFVLNYATFEKYQNYKFLFRDTMKKSISDIIDFRIKQKYCFDFNKCSNDTYYNNISCLKKHPVLKNSKRCSWAWYYYPRILIKSMSSIACIELNYPGLALPVQLIYIQNNTFFCYAKYNEQITDNPLKN